MFLIIILLIIEFKYAKLYKCRGLNIYFVYIFEIY